MTVAALPPLSLPPRPSGAATATPIVVRIRADWDSALTYDSLDTPSSHQPGNDGPVFVGRKDLLDPLVAAIRQPAERGTYLLSGYRGTGKTTLLIEALRRGRAQLPADWRLFPLILNVSEVSASLEGDPKQPEVALKIEPKRLLVALLRALQHNTGLIDQERPLSADLKDAIGDTYRKATAIEYSQLVTDRAEASRSATQEAGVDIKVADLYKLLGVASGLGAAFLGALAVAGPAMKALYAAIPVLTGLSATSFAMSRKVTRSSTQARNEARSLKYDNSVQQLENDLKDILARLYQRKLRTVVVLEELDKIKDENGQQLDAVIRYFKNLFTQAPALFFFVTDKAYFDFISSRIKEARRRRSYAVEHTFFTHRVFVGRPTTRDCLDYLRAVVLDEALQARLQSTYTATDPLAKSLQDLDAFAQFVRVLLFRAANHLFDLKNEMRRFIRAGNGVGADAGIELVIDRQSLPEDQAAVAVLQDRVEEKVRSFALASGRSYANEVLHDCLYSVFNELGSTRPQRIADFYPFRPRSEGDVKSQPELLLDEQLEWNEVQRIEDAVTSLIGDLHRGEAFDREKTDATKEFVWKPNAAREFKYVRKLEPYEERLVSVIRRLSAAAAAFQPEGLLASLVTNAGQAAVLVEQLEQRAKELEKADSPLQAEVAQDEIVARRSEVGALTAAGYAKQLGRLTELYNLSPPSVVAPSSQGGGVYLIQNTRGDPRFTTQLPAGAALLVQGDGDRLHDDVREFVASVRNLERLALVHVLHAPGDPAASADWQQRWIAENQRLGIPAFVPRVLPLDEGLSSPAVADRWGHALGREILFRTYWTAQVAAGGIYDATQKRFVDPDPMVLMVVADNTTRRLTLSAALAEWLRAPDRLLSISPSPTPLDSLMEVLKILCRAPFKDVAAIEAVPASLVPADPPGMAQGGVLQSLWNQFFIGAGLPTPLPIENAGAVVSALISDGTLIVATRDPLTDPAATQAFADMLGTRGRGIILTSGPPESLKGLGVTKLEFTPT